MQPDYSFHQAKIMLPKPALASRDTSGDSLLLRDIESLSRALSMDNNSKIPPVPNPNHKKLNSKELNKNSSSKKPSFWSAFKSISSQFSNKSNRRFNCEFSLHVRSIDNLPSYFNNSLISVHWKRTTDPQSSSLSTKFARVFNRIANFDETLSCVYSVTGTHNSGKGVAKYESKQFVISVKDNQDLELGKNLIDLTRLLPLSLDELDEEEKRVGDWSTSFRLVGKAKGASLNVSFGFCVISGDEKSGNEKRVGRAGSFSRSRDRSRSVDDVKVLHEVLVSSSKSDDSDLNCVNFEFDKNKIKECGETEFNVVEKGVEMDEKGLESRVKNKEIKKQELRRIEFELEDIFKKKGLKMTNFEKGDEVLKQDLEKIELKEEKEIKEPVLEKMEFIVRNEEEVAVKIKNEEAEKQESKMIEFELEDQLKELELELEKIGKEDEGVEVGMHGLGRAPDLEGVMYDYEHVYDKLPRRFSSSAIFDMHVEPKTPNQMVHEELKSSYKSRVSPKSNSLNFDDETVASEFLSMLGIDHSPLGLNSDSDPESPRGRLWKQFTKETMPSSTSRSIFDIGKEPELVEEDFDFAEDFDLSKIVQEAEMELQKANEIKSRAKIIEDAESEALMRQWGLDKDTFHQSPPDNKSGFGSPIDLPPEEPVELPPLGEGLGSFIRTNDGGFLKSMSPTLFANAKNSGNLIMQVSKPVVVPAEMGSGIMEILQKLASVGIEKLSLQAKKLMPLEEITGRTMEQITWEATPALESCGRREHSQALKSGKEPSVKDQISTKKAKKNQSYNSASEYVSLEDLAPSAMDKIESLSIEGLRIQSGMSDTEAPSNISPQSIGNISTLEGKGTMESTGGLQLLDVKDSSDDIDGLMGLSITLDEWMQLDSGIIDDDIISDRTSKILAAHHARSSEMMARGKNNGKKSGKKWGLLGNTFTVALMVQLRDPLRNYEPAGTPMLSLIQVERVFIPPKPKIYNISEKGNSVAYDEEDDLLENTSGVVEEKSKEEETVPQFKVTEVHVAGIKTDAGKKLWGNPMQQKSGSRWLLATGMGKSNKHPFLKAKPVSKPSSSEMNSSTTAKAGDTLWSISSRILGDGGKWKELLALNPHIRNPNIIFPNEKIRLR